MRHHHPLARTVVITAIALVFGAWSESPAAGSRTPPPGTTLDNVRLPLLAGGARDLLGQKTIDALIFLRPDQDHSKTSVARIAEVEKELGNKVRWTAVVGTRFKKDQIDKLLAGSGLAAPVTLDKDGAYRNRLGVVLEPMVVIVSRDHKLVGLQAYHQVNYAPLLRARLRHALGEIDDAELARIVDPPANGKAMNKEDAKAHRYIKLAARYLAQGKHDKAVAAARKAITHDASIALAHVLEGEGLAAGGDCKSALAAFERALAIDARDARAIAGKKKCAKGA